MPKAKSPPPAAGYSKRPLVQKLGIKPGQRVCFLNAPDHYPELLGPLPDGVRESRSLRGNQEFIHLFSDRAQRLERRLPSLRRALVPDGVLWISWPKGSSGVATDLDGNVVRRLGLAAGLVDVKVCAVDEVWSGLKFVIPVKDRPRAESFRSPSR